MHGALPPASDGVEFYSEIGRFGAAFGLGRFFCGFSLRRSMTLDDVNQASVCLDQGDEMFMLSSGESWSFYR